MRMDLIGFNFEVLLDHFHDIIHTYLTMMIEDFVDEMR